MKEKSAGVAFAEPIYSNDGSHGQWEPDWRADFVDNVSHPKTTGKLSLKHRKNGSQETPPKKLESLKPRALKKLEQRGMKYDFQGITFSLFHELFSVLSCPIGSCGFFV